MNRLGVKTPGEGMIIVHLNPLFGGVELFRGMNSFRIDLLFKTI
jgi:hypothetical protein